MAATRLLSIILPVLMAAAVSAQSQDRFCNTSAGAFYMDIFNEVLHNHPEVARGLTSSPSIQGMDTTSPAYEFTGMGSGFTLTSMSNQIRKMSCDHNEVTFSWRAFIRDSQSDGPLIELSYSGGFEPGLAVYMVYMDAAANEIVVAYRHQGKLRSESIPIRLIAGRWRDYAITLSGNLLTFHFDCEVVHQRLIPLPDYCSNESPVLLTVVNSVNGGIEFTGATGLYIYLQNLGIQFGPDGVKKQCPDTPQVCPTCGQFLTVIEKLVTAEEELAVLQKKIDELESVSCPTTTTTAGDVPGSTANCVMDIEGVQHVFKNGEFLVTSQSMICYCNNGEDVCVNLDDDVNINFPTANCNSTAAPTGATTSTTTGGQRDPTPTPEPDTCLFADFGGKSVPAGDCITRREEDNCIIGRCIRNVFGLRLVRDTEVCPPEGSIDCPSLMDKEEKKIALCCGNCDSCDFMTCVDNAGCILQDSPANSATCDCNEGYVFNSSNECVDIDECLDTNFNTCDAANSVCLNTEGSFLCECLPGYSMEADSNNDNSCVDDDECFAVTHNCSEFSTCMNTAGGFKCECNQNYTRNEEGTCVAVCVFPCQNGGKCDGPNHCTCLPEYTGLSCEVDVDECGSPLLNRCNGTRSECVNTDGSYFCRCAKGFQERDSECRDVNECTQKIHNCVGSSSCVNTPGSYRCLCNNIGGGLMDCTGSCLRRQILYEDGDRFIDNCRRCVCLGGEMTCRLIECDCNNRSSYPEGCCSECNRRDCVIMDGLRIRPGSTWINPANRCERYDCLQNLTAVFVNLTESCPSLDCPVSMRPMGKCCPICMLPTCDESLDGKSLSIRNGCETCVCENSKWTCNDRVTCPPANCQPQDIVFLSKGGCCPVCRQEILGSPPQCIS